MAVFFIRGEWQPFSRAYTVLVIHMAECSDLKNFTPEELSYSATTIATAMAKNLDDDSVAVLSSFFFGIGSTLGLISRQRTLIKDCCQNDKPRK